MLISKLIKEAYQFGMSQHEFEIESFLQLIQNKEINNVLEIGSKLGGTLYLWRRLAKGIVASIDLPGGKYGGWIMNDHPYLGNCLKKRNSFFKKFQVNMISGNSTDIKIIKKTNTLFKDKTIDLLFLDGDHTYDGIKADYENYKHLMSKNGIIAFHDIVDSEHHKYLNVGVNKFWNELEGNKTEIIENSIWGYGIGVLQL